MKRIFISLFLFVFLSILFAQNLELTQDTLLSSRWCPEGGSWGYWLTFQDDNSYQIRFAGEGGGQFVIGSYRIEDNTLILEKLEALESDYMPDIVLELRSLWTLEEDSSNYLFCYKLVAEDGYAFWMRESKVDDGEVRLINDYPIVIERIDNCSLLYDSKVRKGPGTEFESSEFFIEGIDIEADYLPEGHEVSVIGHAQDKVSIGEWNDYWYYCDLDLGWYDTGPSHGWIYGALLDK